MIPLTKEEIMSELNKVSNMYNESSCDGVKCSLCPLNEDISSGYYGYTYCEALKRIHINHQKTKENLESKEG